MCHDSILCPSLFLFSFVSAMLQVNTPNHDRSAHQPPRFPETYEKCSCRIHYTTKVPSMVTRRLWLCDVKHKITGLISSHSSPIPLGADIYVPSFLYTSAMFPIQSVHILTFIVGNSPGIHGGLVCALEQHLMRCFYYNIKYYHQNKSTWARVPQVHKL